MLWFYVQYLLNTLPALLTPTREQLNAHCDTLHLLQRLALLQMFVYVYTLISLLPMETWDCTAGRRPCPLQDTG